MTFQPLIPSQGLIGWRFLQRTYDQQLETYAKTPQSQRDSEAFLSRIGAVTSAADLVADRQLLSVALGAFGLQDDLSNTYFVRKILEDGTTATDALANKLSDERYKRLSAAFGFGSGEILQTGNKMAMSRIVEAHFKSGFEVSVGEQEPDLRIALYAQRELLDLATDRSSEDTKWFKVMSLPPLRSMFETALGLPAAFSQLDIDKQLEMFRDKTAATMGNSTIGQFANPDSLSRITDTFLARSQLANLTTTYSPAAAALTLLQR